jgi:hypothetical protein
LGGGLFAGIRARRAARVSARLDRRASRLNAIAHAHAGIGCGHAAVGCGEEYSKSPMQKEQSPVQKATAGDDVPDPPAFSNLVEPPAGDVLRPAQFPTNASAAIERTDFRIVLVAPRLPRLEGATLLASL